MKIIFLMLLFILGLILLVNGVKNYYDIYYNYGQTQLEKSHINAQLLSIYGCTVIVISVMWYLFIVYHKK